MRTSRIIPWSMAGVLSLSLCLFASAGDKHLGEKGPGADVVEPASAHAFVPRLTESNKLIGTKIQSPGGEKYGEVEELLLNENRDRLMYVIASIEPVTGAKGTLTPIPWPALKISEDRKTMVLDMEKSRLSAAPGFAEDNYVALTERSWCSEINRFYGQEEQMRKEFKSDQEKAGRTEQGAKPDTPEAADTPQKGQILAPLDQPVTPPERAERAEQNDKLWGRKVSELIGMAVRDGQTEELGHIKHVMADLHRGHLAFAIVSFGGLLGLGEKEAPVPWTSIDLVPQEKIVRANTSTATLEAVAFKSGESPANLSDRAYALRIHQRFNQEPYWEIFGYVGQQMETLRFDPAQMRTIEGTVQRVGSFNPGGAAVQCQELHLRKLDGTAVTVRAAPEDFARQHGITFNVGDRIAVTGSHSMAGDQSVIIATEIRKGDQTLRLRDAARGSELWSAGQSPGSGEHQKQSPQPQQPVGPGY